MRILSWNVSGSCSAKKRDELLGILNYWQNANPPDPVVIICLQEVSVQGCTIEPALESWGFDCFSALEGSGGGGKRQLIAIKRDVVQSFGNNWVLPLPLDENEAALHERLPLCVEFTGKDGQARLIITYHAPNDDYRFDLLCKLSKAINARVGQYAAIYLAGDLNVDEKDEGILCIENGTSYFPNRLDHIVAWGGQISDYYCSDDSESDHVPISARFFPPPKEEE